MNTDRRNLDLPQMSALRRLRDMPLPDNGGWACLSWQGGRVPLHDGYSAGSRVIGEIRPGDWIGFGFIGVGDWNVVTVSRGQAAGGRMLGWVESDKVNWLAFCPEMAG